jgi:zinc transport system substrate-binding protein
LGDTVAVECLIESGEDPVHWTPDAEDLARITHAQALLINGVGLEGWLMSANLAPTRVIEASVAFTDRWIQNEDSAQHSHGNRGAHSHKGLDPHVWMDPLLALEQARTLQQQAIRRGWIHQDLATSRGAQLEQRLRELDGLWTQVGQALNDTALLANHEAYAYPARRYGLKIHVVDADPDLALTPELAAKLKESVRANSPRCMLFESQPHPSVATFLAQDLKLPVVVFSPAESPSESDAIDSMGADLRDLLALLLDQ